MLIPISTDAPIYHFPYACIGMIFLNVVAFLLTGTGSFDAIDQWAPWSLQRGVGLVPVQWVTSNFVHIGFTHLLGNMIFLWGFGIVVEGKLGWWRFVLLYFAIGITQCAIEQTLLLGTEPFDPLMMGGEQFPLTEDEIAEAIQEMDDDGIANERDDEELSVEEREAILSSLPGSAGASSIVFGLLAVSLVWAPENELTLLAFIIRPFTFEASIMAFSAWYIGLEFLGALFQGFSMTTPTLHLMGAILGFGVGVLLLKRNIVDCEDWDLFAVWSGNYGPWARDMYGNRLPKDSEKRRSYTAPVEGPVEKKGKKQSIRSDAAAKKKAAEIETLIEADDLMTAASELFNLRRRIPDTQLDEAPLKTLIVGLIKLEEWNEVEPLMKSYIETYPEVADPMRLRLAKVSLHATGDSQKALRILKDVDREQLSEDALEVFRKLVKAARSH